MKPLVIYHADCADGFGAAFAAWLNLGDEAEYLPMRYNQNIDNVMFCDRDVFILDFSFDKKTMDGIIFVADCVVWLDHHKTSFEMWCGKYKKGMRHGESMNAQRVLIELDDNKSGALLAWEYFHPNTETPAFIRHIDDRDRWQFKLKGSRELHAVLQSCQPWSFEGWRGMFLNSLFGEGIWHVSESLYIEGAAILRAQSATVANVVKNATRCIVDIMDIPVDGHYYASGLAVNCSLYQSEIGHELANASGTYGLIWYTTDGIKAKCSLRSNNDYDVSAIAKAFGGGGHRNAAGFEVDMSTLLSWLS